MMNLILFGPPGAGKGTQTEILCNHLHIPKIGTGDALRGEIRKGTELGQQCKALMDEGKFVPDEIVTEIIRNRVNSPDCAEGFILDGFPRNLNQARQLSVMGIEITKAIVINVPDDVLVERVQGRLVCDNCGLSYHEQNAPPTKPGVCDVCGGHLAARADDKPETVRARLATYHELTQPVVEYYESIGLLAKVDGTRGIHATTDQILKALED